MREIDYGVCCALPHFRFHFYYIHMVGSGDLQVEASFYIQSRKWFLSKTKYNGTNNLMRKKYEKLHVTYM